MFERLLTSHLRRDRKSVLLLGPRQTGKSTLLRSLQPDWTLDLASPATYRTYVARPERLEEELRAAGREVRTVFIDEVQRVPALLDVVQVILDASPKRFRFLLSGSSARKLRRGHANLLPGRVRLHHLHPLLAHELGAAWSLDRAMALGTLPGIQAESRRAAREADLRSYADIYLREEIQAEALVRELGGYARLLDHAAAASGRVLNVNALAQDSGVRYETARRYLEILEDTLIAFRVPAWSGSDRGALIAHPKFFLFDLGVRNALLHRPLSRPPADERGLLLEHVVAYELTRRIGTLWPDARVSYFRTKHGAEVDFVLDAGRELWGIEVKASAEPPRGRLAGLDALAERLPRRTLRKVVVFLGARKLVRDGVEFWPLESWLESLPR